MQKRRWSCRSRYDSGCSGSAQEKLRPFCCPRVIQSALVLGTPRALSQGSTVCSGQLAGWARIWWVPQWPQSLAYCTSHLDPGLGTVEG